MPKRLLDLEQRLTKKNHRDLYLQTKHTLRAIDDLVEEHRRFTSIQALNGVKIDGNEELMFFTTLNEVKLVILSTLEKTLDDLENKWDKHYSKHFQDGVD